MTARTATGAFALAAVATLVAALAAAVPAAGADADADRVSQVRAVGAGTLVQPAAVVFARPDPSSRRLAVLRDLTGDFRPRWVLAHAEARAANGAASWYRISVPGRPNGRTGWIRATTAELQPVTKRLVIYRGARRFELWNGDRVLRRGRVAVGKPGAETPLGLFQVTWKFDPRRDPDSRILGAYAFETSAYSKLTDWPGGGVVGVHGTPWPHLLGRAVSHGCIRLHNRDISWLRSRVPLGTPVKIVR
jgi:lipoprotein-anchoring transpeptidase ErfK/SrfK